MHRRKYKTSQRKKRVQLMQDISVLQKMLYREKNSEKCRIYFVLWKDLVRTCKYNLPLPRDQVRYKRFLQDQTSIRRMFNVFVNHNHACPDYYTDQHCIDLLTTINNFKLPPPDKTWLQHYSFLRRDYEGTVVEDSFKGIYRNHYVIWFTFCNIARLLQTVPTLNLIDIFGPHVFQMFYECIGLRLEERLIVNADTYVATVSALYRRFIEYVETNFFDVNEVPSLEGYCERSGPPKGLNLLKTCYRRLRIPLEGERAPAIEALDQPTGCRALDPSLRVQFLVKALDPFTVKREIVQFLAVEMLKSLFLKNQKYIFQRAVQRVNKQWNDGTTITSLQNLEKTSIEMKQQQWMSHFDTETEKKFASGTLVMMVIDSKTSYDRPIIFDFLAQFASVIHTQLPKMPRHYILRLLLNSKHKCLVLVNYNDESSPLRTWRVVGGICFRTFPSQEFSEIVFVTISTENQVHGYGTFLMNELKRYHVEHLGYQHLLTFADNNAFGYFKKQHFSTDVLIPEVQYNNFIKCYDGAKLMYCQAKVCNNQEEEDNALIFILDKIDKFEKLIVKNRDMKFKASDIFKQQGISHQPIDELFPDNVLTVPRNNSSLIRTLVALCGRRPKPAGDYVSEKKLVTTIVPQPRRKFTGINPALPRLKIKMSKAKPKAQIVYQFVGLDEYPEDRVYDEYELMRETPLEMYLEKLHPDSLKMNSVGLPMSFTSSKPKFMTIRNSPYKLTVHVYQKTKLLHAAMMRFPLSWPFHYPVDSYDAPNYAESIYMPMTLEIIGIRLRNMYYKTFEMVFADFNRIFTNCYSFNEQRGGHYYHCCYRCHQYFNRFASHVFNGYNISAFLLPMPELKTTFPQHNRKRAKVAFDSLRPYWYPDLPDSDINESTDEENIDSDDEYAKLMKAIRQIQKEEQTKLDPPLKSPVKALPKKGRSVVKPKVKSLPKPKNRPAKTRAQKAELKPKSLTKPTKIGERQADSGLSTRTRRQIQPEPTTPRVLRPRGTVIKSPPPTKQLPTKKTLSLVVSPPKSVSVERIPSLPPRTRRNAATVATMTMGKVVSKVQKNSPRKAVSVEKVTERLSKAGSKPATTRKTKVIEKATLLKSTSQSPQKKLIQTKLNFAPLQLSKQSSKKGPLKPVEKPMEKSLKPSPPLTRTALREAQQKSTLTLLEPEVTQPQEIPKKTVKRKASIKTKKTPSPSPPLTRTAAAKTKSMPLVDTETKQQRLPEPVKSFPRTKTTRTATKLQAKMMTVVAKQSPKQSTSPSRTRVIKKQQLETVTTEAKKALSPNPTLSPPRTRTAKRIVKSKSTPSESVPKSPEPIECTNKTSVKKSLSTAEAVSEEVEPPQKLASPESSQSLLLPRITRRAAHAMQAKEETKEQTPEPNASTSKKAVKSTVNADGLSALDLIVTEVPTNDSKRQPRSTVKAKRVTQQQRLRQKNTQPSKLPQIKKKLISSQMTIEVVEELKPSELVLSPPHIRITRSTAHAMEAEGEQEKLFEVLHPKQEQKKPKKATKPKPKSLAKSTEKNKPPEVVDLLLPDLEGRKLTRSKKRQQQAEHQENTSAKSAGLQTAQRHGSDVKVPLLPDSSRLKAELPKPHTKLCRVKEEPRSPSPRHTRATTRAATKASANLPSPRRRGKKR